MALAGTSLCPTARGRWGWEGAELNILWLFFGGGEAPHAVQERAVAVLFPQEGRGPGAPGLGAVSLPCEELSTVALPLL